jgi:2-hydroxy-3-oxopropionate reductase
MSAKVPKIIRRNFQSSATIAVNQKVLKNAVQLAGELGVEVPMSKMILDYMNYLEAENKVNEDHCAIAKVYEKNMDVVVKRNKPV